MQLPDVLFVLMGTCLAIIVAVLIYAVIKEEKLTVRGTAHC
ncbi:hypothetical protein SAMN04489738_3647 [Pseudarthrobacter chlorophenolicus]|nr:hypothetical protein SAMN04489738_3647 [Pseudarthrobacter chlorophenolicus]